MTMWTASDVLVSVSGSLIYLDTETNFDEFTPEQARDVARMLIAAADHITGATNANRS
jgi:hypothetical protein